MSAAAVGGSRFRPRRARIRREPIDLELLAAELVDPVVGIAQPSVVAVPKSDQEILRALEAAVARVKAVRAAAAITPPVVEADVAPPVVEVKVEASLPVVEVEATPRPATNVGLPLDQVQAWLDQVEDDLRRLEARVEYLQAEQSRLQSQHQLVAELISSSTPV